MNLRFIRPEDRRRSGGSGTGPGFGTEWADTEPACFRSEAFAEDLQPDERGCVHAPHPSRVAPARRPRHNWAFGVALMAALGMGLRTGD